MWRLRAWTCALALVAGGAAAVLEPESGAGGNSVVNAVDVRAAAHAWGKLRGLRGLPTHALQRRETAAAEEEAEAAGEEPTSAAPAAAPREAAGDAKGHSMRLAEFTMSAESSFTAVSRALDRLANRSRDAAAPIASTEFVVEGNVDAETLQKYLRSHAATAALARAEEAALRRVVGMLLTAPPPTPTASHESTRTREKTSTVAPTAAPNRIRREAKKPPPPPPLATQRASRAFALHAQPPQRYHGDSLGRVIRQWDESGDEEDDLDEEEDDTVATGGNARAIPAADDDDVDSDDVNESEDDDFGGGVGRLTYRRHGRPPHHGVGDDDDDNSDNSEDDELGERAWADLRSSRNSFAFVGSDDNYTEDDDNDDVDSDTEEIGRGPVVRSIDQ